MNAVVHRVVAPVLLAGAVVLAGCAAPGPKPLYQWEGYQSQLYQHLRSPGADAPAQLAALEKDMEKVRAQSGALPPGFQAHLAYLYFATGNDAKAVASLRAEAEAFPEFGPYMNFLLARYQKP